MKFKKTAASIAAALMLLTSSPALAASAGSSQTTEITVNCLIPDVKIQVVVPTASEVYVNPKSLPVRIDGKIDESQIISEPACIENKTEVPLLISASVTGVIKEGSDMTLGSSSTQGATTRSKKAFIYFEMKAADSEDEDVAWDAAYDVNKHIRVSTVAKSKKNFLTLGAAGTSGCFGVFHLAGDCIANPRTEWTTDDGVDVNVSFTFIPVPLEEET